MVAANGVIARTFERRGRRFHSPHRAHAQALGPHRRSWPQAKGTTLPAEPDSKALNDFLLAQKQKDPDHFPDLSLTVIKLMGPGEYVLVKPNQPSPGHFGLAVQDYTHSTAPNRRFPDMVTQRLLKAWLAQAAAALLRRSAQCHRAAMHADGRRRAQGGARDAEAHRRRGAAPAHRPELSRPSSPASTTTEPSSAPSIRTSTAMLVQGGKGLDVGDRVTVKLVSTDPQRGIHRFCGVRLLF